MSNKTKTVLNKQQTFTNRKLADFLNEKFGSKTSGKKFTLSDIQQYVRRGFLPRKYGFHPLEQIIDESIGIKLVKVDFSKTHK